MKHIEITPCVNGLAVVLHDSEQPDLDISQRCWVAEDIKSCIRQLEKVIPKIIP